MSRPLNLKPLFDEKTLQARIQALGKQIAQDLHGEPLVVIGVLKGAFIFLADLVRAIPVPQRIEFVGVASYAGTVSTGHVKITHDLSADIEGQNVLLVEDIVDTGKTIDYLMSLLAIRNPKTLRICTLLSKPEAHEITRPIDYVGFEISREFVIGYGLDLDGRFRELPYIAQVVS